jgi:hypothetical protein
VKRKGGAGASDRLPEWFDAPAAAFDGWFAFVG